jgi:glycosyltransferase involved in cell wall biosynthesis
MPKVSVIIPTYNYKQFIQKAIDSVLTQTYKDVEIIVVDDGSTDNTRDIIESKYAHKVAYIYQDNKGASAARNKGIALSHGEYLVFLDADDYFLSSSIEERLTILEDNKSIGWVYSRWQYVDIEGNILEDAFHNAPFAYKKRLRGNIFMDMLSGTLINTSSVLLRRSCAEDTGGFDDRLSAFQDYDFWLRVSHRHQVEYLDKVLVYITAHKESISFTQPPYPARAIINKKIEENYRNYLPELGITWRKIKASEFNYSGNSFLENGNLNQALREFKRSIREYPCQKRVYLQVLKIFFKRFNLL